MLFAPTLARALPRILLVTLALMLAWPSPASALRKSQEDGTVAELAAGLEEHGTPQAFLDAAGLSAAWTLQRLAAVAAALQTHPGGETSHEALRTFLARPELRVQLQGVEPSALTDRQLDAAVVTDNVLRVRENIIRRGGDHPRLPLGERRPLAPLIALEARTRLANYFQAHLGGRLTEPELAQAVSTSMYHLSSVAQFGLDYRELLAVENALRLEENVVRRAADQPLLSLIAMDAQTAALDAIQRFRGGYLMMKKLTDAAGSHASHLARLGWTLDDRNGEVAAENARRRRANALRRAMGKPPIPRVARFPVMAIQYALEDWWGDGKPTREQLAAFANVSLGQLNRYLTPQVLAAANIHRKAQALPSLPETLLSAAGLEEPPAPFVPWVEAPGRVLVRAGLRRSLPDYPPLTIERLYEHLTPHLQRHLQATYEIDKTPLVLLPGPTRALGKPVFLLREALLPTGSSKPRMLAVLFDLFQHGDPENLTGRLGLPLPKVLGTQSTGNHLQAMAWFGQTIRSLGTRWSDLQVIGFTMRGIPDQKRFTAQQLGATVWDQFADYGEARRAMERMARDEGSTFLRWNHGDRPIVLGNATTAIQLHEQIAREQLLRDRRIAVISAAGAAGRIAGLSVGLTQEWEDAFTVIGAETDRIQPLFAAAAAGKPVPIQLPPQRVPEDGIAVDQVEAEALRVFLSRGDAVALVEPAQALSYTHWLLDELTRLAGGTSVHHWPTQTEVVTGMSLAVPFLYPALFADVDAVIVDETGMNIDPGDIEQVRGVSLPEPAAGLEESLAVPAADQARLQHLRARLLDALLDSNTALPAGGRITPAWILQAVPGTRYQDLYLINLLAVVGEANARLGEAGSKQVYGFDWRNDARRGPYRGVAPHAFEKRLAMARIAWFLHEHPGGLLSPSDIAQHAGVDVEHLFAVRNRHDAVDCRTLVMLDNLYRTMDHSARPPIVPTGFMETRTHGDAMRALQNHPGGYLPLRELARLAGISPRTYLLGHIDPYLLTAAANARRAAANLCHPKDPPARFVALDGLTAILHVVDQHPGGRVTVARLAQLAGLRPNTARHNVLARTLVGEGNARRALETPPRSPIILPSVTGHFTPAGLEEPVGAARWQQLLEGRTGRGIVVVPTGIFGTFAKDIEPFLTPTPPPLARSIVLWGQGPIIDRVAAANPELRVVRDEHFDTLVDFIATLEGPSSIGYVATTGLGDAAAEALESNLRARGIPARVDSLSPLDLLKWLEILGVPKAVLKQVGLEEVRSEQYVGSGT